MHGTEIKIIILVYPILLHNNHHCIMLKYICICISLSSSTLPSMMVHHHHDLPPDERITSDRDQPSHGFHRCRQSRKRSHKIHKKEAPGKSLSPSSTLNVVTFFFNECLLLSEMKISVLPIKKEVQDTQHYISTEMLRDCKNDEGLVIQKMGM